MTMQDLQETAALAHLNLSEQELAAAFPAFVQMLGYFDAMQAAESDPSLARAGHTEGMAASARQVSAGWFRSDTAHPARPQTSDDLPESMLAQSGERDGRFVVIPNVL